MKIDIKKALAEAEARLEKALPEIEKRLKKAADKNIEEPDHLRTGISLGELSVKRAQKEQENEDPTR